MKDYLETILHQSVEIKEYESLYTELPLLYRGNYVIYEMKMSGIAWTAMKPKKEIGLVELRKNYRKVTKVSGQNCVLILEKVNYYMKEKLIKEGIPFIIPQKQIYLPFIGMLLDENGERKITPVHEISYLTQKLILTAVYGKWNNMTVTKAAEKLMVSKMSISRCFDEIEYLDIPILGMKGRSRVININDDRQKMWTFLEQEMRNPIISRYELAEDIHLKIKAGMSALCEYSMLSDNDYPTYAVTKKDLKKVDLAKKRKISRGEPIGCSVLELGYIINYRESDLQDPFSVMLSLTDKEKEDERVILSVKEMLKENVWLRD